MIYISQGHERGIGLEVFFKSTLSLSQGVLDEFNLFASEASCSTTLKSLNLDYKINDTFILILNKRIRLTKINSDTANTESSDSLIRILKVIQSNDILITLPTSKDQLPLKGHNCAGYTEFFRNYYNIPSLSMIFKSYDLKVLLLSDHIALSQVPKNITTELTYTKTKKTLNAIAQYFCNNPDEVIFSGINPHAGEDGILGHEDSYIEEAIKLLTKDFPQISFKGPLPGDTLHFHQKQSLDQLFVYAFHDQGLPFFKDKYGLFGINITMGLDFLRMSVDHGTAFSLFGRNLASSSGCLYVLNEAYKIHSRR